MLNSKDNEEYVKWWNYWLSQIEQRRVIMKHSSSKVAGAGLKSAQEQPSMPLLSRGGAKDNSNHAADEPSTRGLGLGPSPEISAADRLK